MRAVTHPAYKINTPRTQSRHSLHTTCTQPGCDGEHHLIRNVALHQIRAVWVLYAGCVRAVSGLGPTSKRAVLHPGRVRFSGTRFGCGPDSVSGGCTVWACLLI